MTMAVNKRLPMNGRLYGGTFNRCQPYIFSDKPGYFDLVEHEIKILPSFTPKCLRAYWIPKLLKPEVQRQNDEMLKPGIISSSTSDIASPIVLNDERTRWKRGCSLGDWLSQRQQTLSWRQISHTRCPRCSPMSWQIPLHKLLRCEQWLLTIKSSPWLSPSICLSLWCWTFWIQSHALWIEISSKHIHSLFLSSYNLSKLLPNLLSTIWQSIQWLGTTIWNILTNY